MIPHYTVRQGLLHRPIKAEFARPSFHNPDTNILATRDLVAECHIANHAFFEAARDAQELVVYWVTQELFIANPFAQLLLRVAASLSNIYIRQKFLTVAAGRHGSLDSEPLASGPGLQLPPRAYLSYRLAEHLSIRLENAKQAIETLQYMQTFTNLCRTPMLAMGAFGAGNELLVEEYNTARSACASVCGSASDLLRFFDAIIEATTGHGPICESIAMALKNQGYQTKDYLVGARRSLKARIRFYDTAARRAGIRINRQSIELP